MNQGYNIRYIDKESIDLGKWDRCIDFSKNGLIYGKSWYLDHMTGGQWDALILDDYEAIMPLTWKERWGIRYLYQPALTPQLGIFSQKEISGALVTAFLLLANKHFRFAEIFLNYGNPCSIPPNRTNFILPLHESYSRLSGNYKKDLVKNLKYAGRSPMHYRSDFNLQKALTLFRDHYEKKTPHVKAKTWLQFETLCHYLQSHGRILLRAITDQDDQPLATALLPAENGRMYLLQSSCLPEGRKMKANHFLLDAIIREFAGTGTILDFDGSELPGVAHFYSNFGGLDQRYYFYRYNHLPWPLQLLKK